jgi:hypothetical protein
MISKGRDISGTYPMFSTILRKAIFIDDFIYGNI